MKTTSRFRAPFGNTLSAGAPALCVLAFVAGSVACSSDPAKPPSGGADAGTDTGPGPSNGTATVGTFKLELKAPVPPSQEDPQGTPGFTAIDGQVASGPNPPLLQLKETGKQGDCRLLIPHAPFCSPGCGTTGVCVAADGGNDGACVPYPQPRNVGTVTITGLNGAAGPITVTMAPTPPGYFYAPGPETKLAYPAFQEGTALALEASGADVPKFNLTGKGITVLEVTSATPIPIDRGKPVALRWKAPGRPELSRIKVKLDISHHGGLKGLLLCDTGDTGSLDLPAMLVDRLIDLGVAGYPTVTLTRESLSSTQTSAGKVDLVVMSASELPVKVAGYTSCDEDKEPCPAGKTCGADRLCH